MVIRNKCIVGAATSRPPRWMYNLWGWMVSPKIWYPHCSGGNLPPSGPEVRNRGTFVFVSSNVKTFVIVLRDTIQQNRLYLLRCQPLDGAGWRWVNAATLFRILGYTIHRNRLYMPCGGRQIAAPTSMHNVFAFYEHYLIVNTLNIR